MELILCIALSIVLAGCGLVVIRTPSAVISGAAIGPLAVYVGWPRLHAHLISASTVTLAWEAAGAVVVVPAFWMLGRLSTRTLG